MIVSHKYRFIFIKTKKTAGTSIELLLSQLCGDGDIVTPIYPPEDGYIPRNWEGFLNPLPEMIELLKAKKLHVGTTLGGPIKNCIRRQKFNQHISAWKVKNRIPIEWWNNYYKFCVERNPWDKTISAFYFHKSRAGFNYSFDEYIIRCAKNYCKYGKPVPGINGKPNLFKLPLNYPLYTDFSNNIMVDYIISYENLNDELKRICEHLSIPFEGSLNFFAKGQYRKDKRSYEEILTKKQYELIKEIYHKELEIMEKKCNNTL